jgi:hypothetical protein
MSDYKGITVVPQSIFREWFRQLDTDGDNKVDIVQIAYKIKDL